MGCNCTEEIDLLRKTWKSHIQHAHYSSLEGFKGAAANWLNKAKEARLAIAVQKPEVTRFHQTWCIDLLSKSFKGG